MLLLIEKKIFVFGTLFLSNIPLNETFSLRNDKLSIISWRGNFVEINWFQKLTFPFDPPKNKKTCVFYVSGSQRKKLVSEIILFARS